MGLRAGKDFKEVGFWVKDELVQLRVSACVMVEQLSSQKLAEH